MMEDRRQAKVKKTILLYAKESIERLLVKEDRKLKKLLSKGAAQALNRNHFTRNDKVTYSNVHNQRYVEMSIDSIDLFKDSLIEINNQLELLEGVEK